MPPIPLTPHPSPLTPHPSLPPHRSSSQAGATRSCACGRIGQWPRRRSGSTRPSAACWWSSSCTTTCGTRDTTRWGHQTAPDRPRPPHRPHRPGGPCATFPSPCIRPCPCHCPCHRPCTCPCSPPSPCTRMRTHCVPALSLPPRTRPSRLGGFALCHSHGPPAAPARAPSPLGARGGGRGRQPPSTHIPCPIV